MSEDIKAGVKEKYGRAALRVTSGGAAGCGTVSSRGAADLVTSNLYGCGKNGIIMSVPRVSLLPGVDMRFAAGSPSAYYVVAACLGLAFVLARWLVGSSLGLVLRGIKGNELRTLALEYRVGAYKVLVNVIAGALTAVGGILYALSQGFVSVDLLRVLRSVEVIVWTILGGPGTLLGPVLAAVLMSLGVDCLRSVTHQYLIAFGAITLLVALALPEGLGGLVERLLKRPAREVGP